MVELKPRNDKTAFAGIRPRWGLIKTEASRGLQLIFKIHPQCTVVATVIFVEHMMTFGIL